MNQWEKVLKGICRLLVLRRHPELRAHFSLVWQVIQKESCPAEGGVVRDGRLPATFGIWDSEGSEAIAHLLQVKVVIEEVHRRMLRLGVPATEAAKTIVVQVCKDENAEMVKDDLLGILDRLVASVRGDAGTQEVGNSKRHLGHQDSPGLKDILKAVEEASRQVKGSGPPSDQAIFSLYEGYRATRRPLPMADPWAAFSKQLNRQYKMHAVLLNEYGIDLEALVNKYRSKAVAIYYGRKNMQKKR